MKLTKSDFIQYLNCPESLWLKKHKPGDYPKGDMSLFLEKLSAEGYVVEDYVKQMFPDGIDLPDHGTAQQTQEALAEHDTLFQPKFETPEGLLARADVLKKAEDGSYHLLEVKSGTSVKRTGQHNQVKDACFQKYVIEQCGLTVSKVAIIHLNKEYVKNGEIDVNELLHIEDVTAEIDELSAKVVPQIHEALAFVNKTEIDETGCACSVKTRSNHCDSFEYFNPDVPENNIYQINRIRANKVEQLVAANQIELAAVPVDFDINETQKKQVESYRKQAPVIDLHEIRKMLGDLAFPLHFYDYETYATAVPILDGMRPHQHLVFQVSMHTMQEDGTLSHCEYLADQLIQPKQMLEKMSTITGLDGTFVSWNKSFENTRNKDLMVIFPEFAEYLEYINTHTFDLEDVFKKPYIDYRFNGSSSIKNVLPIICPELSYKDLDIQDGTMAMDTWGRMVLDPEFEEDRAETRKNLLSYCEMDSKAMVEIYEKLKLL